jgi:hypothetical protein
MQGMKEIEEEKQRFLSPSKLKNKVYFLPLPGLGTTLIALYRGMHDFSGLSRFRYEFHRR